MMKRLFLVSTIICSFYSLQAQDYKFGEVSKEEISQKVHPTYPDADASILYRNVDTRFDYNQEDGFLIFLSGESPVVGVFLLELVLSWHRGLCVLSYVSDLFQHDYQICVLKYLEAS